ncbi:hypothetical protein GCM10007382_26870 [Salinibacterium xinjiangense]|nr:hypothetical protein GCM10007382_26870 [Salinibacterium xinjiangense]
MLHEGVRFPLGMASAGLAILYFLSLAQAEAYLAWDLLEAEWGASHAIPVLRQRIARDAATRLRGQPGPHCGRRLGYGSSNVRRVRPPRMGAQPHRDRVTLQHFTQARTEQAAAGTGTRDHQKTKKSIDRRTTVM